MRRIAFLGFALSLWTVCQLCGVTGQQITTRPTGAIDGPATTLPTDPLQRAATKALRGDFGPLKPWQRNGYAAALKRGVTVQGKAWVTSYYPSEGFWPGKPTRSGIGVSLRSAAVCRREWQSLRGRWVWTAAYGLRVIEDTGANSNHKYAARKGADRWLDFYFLRNHPANPVTPFAIW